MDPPLDSTGPHLRKSIPKARAALDGEMRDGLQVLFRLGSLWHTVAQGCSLQAPVPATHRARFSSKMAQQWVMVQGLGNAGVNAGLGTQGPGVIAGPNTPDGQPPPPPPHPSPPPGQLGGAALCVIAGPTTTAGQPRRTRDDIMAGPILLSVEGPRTGWASVTHKNAYDYLNALRARMPPSRWMDLTDNSVFDWRTYLLYREDFARIIGPGVVAFEFHQFNSWDTWTNDWRTDFVVRRVDGTDFRLHPYPKKYSGQPEAEPVGPGQLDEWLAAQEVPAPARRHVPQHRDAREFLKKVLGDWERNGKQGNFARELSQAEWPWHEYMSHDNFRVHLVGEHAVSMRIARRFESPCFAGRTNKGVPFEIYFTECGRYRLQQHWKGVDVEN